MRSRVAIACALALIGAGCVLGAPSRRLSAARYAPLFGLIRYFFPVLWIILTAFKTRKDALAVPPKLFFTPTLDNFVSVFYRASITTGGVKAEW